MCDVNPEKLSTEESMVSRKKLLVGSTCMKCKKEKAIVVVRIGDPLCALCFLTYVTHKFRSTLGKSKLIQANDNVLLALSGGHSSTALLHLVRDALSEGAHKRLRFSPGIICIDESATLTCGYEQDYSHIRRLAEEYGYPFHLVPIYKDFSTSVNHDDGNRQLFIKSFESISTLTAQQDFLVTQRLSLIINMAMKNGYQKVMFGDTSTTLSVKLLSQISLGRGSSIPLDIGVSDDRYPNITIVRPMREISSKEVAIFNRLSNITVSLPRNITTMRNCDASLQQKTEEFIIALQTDFPHTVNTVFRTGDKICKTEKFSDSEQKCVMCGTPLSNSASRKTCNDVADDTSNSCCNSNANDNDNGIDKEEGCCGSGDDCSSKGFKLTIEQMTDLLCYGCRLTFKDMGYNMELLPNKILERASAHMKRMKMKESIQEFLLE